jgi:hypothetical protein
LEPLVNRRLDCHGSAHMHCSNPLINQKLGLLCLSEPFHFSDAGLFITSGFCYSMLDQDVALECGDQLLHPLPGKPTEVGTIYLTLPFGVRLEAFSLESRRHQPAKRLRCVFEQPVV